jgi:hypothetical protein
MSIDCLFGLRTSKDNEMESEMQDILRHGWVCLPDGSWETRQRIDECEREFSKQRCEDCGRRNDYCACDFCLECGEKMKNCPIAR